MLGVRRWRPACLALCVLAAVLAWLGTHHVAPLRQGALLLDDLRLASFAPPRAQREDVIVLTIGEETLAQFPFRSPINRRLIADLVTTLSERKLRALGIDLIFDQPTTAADDAALLAALDSFPAPSVIAVAGAKNGLTPRQLAFQDQFLAGHDVGLAGMLMTNGTVRHIYPGEQTAAGYKPSFAAALARAVGAEPPREPTLLYYRTARDGAPAIRTFPAQHVAALPAAWFDDAIVLIGADLPNQDTFRTPLSVAQGGAAMAGIFVHAQALVQLLDGIRYPALGGAGEALFIVLAALVGVTLPFAPFHLQWKTAIALATVGGYWAVAWFYFAAGGALLPLLSPTLALLLALAFGTAYARRLDQVEKRLVRDAFGRYVSPPIIEQILADPSKLALGGEKREMSFVFSDLEGFTTLAESLPPERALGAAPELSRRHAAHRLRARRYRRSHRRRRHRGILRRTVESTRPCAARGGVRARLGPLLRSVSRCTSRRRSRRSASRGSACTRARPSSAMWARPTASTTRLTATA